MTRIFQSESGDDNVEKNREKFLNLINRGGLCKPSDAMYMATVRAQEFLDQLFTGEASTNNYLFQTKNTREVFVTAFSEKISSSKETESLSKIKCEKGHPFLKLIEIGATKMFNIAGKNFANEENSKIHEARGSKRKLKSKADSRNKLTRKCVSFNQTECDDRIVRLR